MKTLDFLQNETARWLSYYWNDEWDHIPMMRHELALIDEIWMAMNDLLCLQDNYDQRRQRATRRVSPVVTCSTILLVNSLRQKRRV